MRVLVATTAGGGHFGPLVPFAEALVNAGHDVTVTAPESFASAVERAGFAHRPFPDTPPEELEAVFQGLGGLSNDEANSVVVGEVFGRIDTRCALPGVEAVVKEWRPDLILRESYEFASYIVARAADIPHVQIGTGLRSLGAFALGVLEESLVSLGAEPGLQGLVSAPMLTMVPESLEDPEYPSPEPVRRFREGGQDHGSDPAGSGLPDWWAGSRDPLCYVTFGSVTAGMGFFPAFYDQVIEALADVPVRVLLTLGDAGEPRALAALPSNVHVEKWWPQREVMPHATVMVGHGGFGTTLLGLASGVPSVVIPLFADQPENARRVAAVGAGIALEGGRAAVGQLSPAVQRVLKDPTYRAGAHRIAGEIRSLPPVEESVPFLEEIAGARVRRQGGRP